MRLKKNNISLILKYNYSEISSSLPAYLPKNKKLFGWYKLKR